MSKFQEICNKVLTEMNPSDMYWHHDIDDENQGSDEDIRFYVEVLTTAAEKELVGYLNTDNEDKIVKNILQATRFKTKDEAEEKAKSVLNGELFSYDIKMEVI